MPQEFIEGYEEAFITTIKASRVHERVSGNVDHYYQCLREFIKAYEEALITIINASGVHERVPGSVDYYYKCLKSS